MTKNPLAVNQSQQARIAEWVTEGPGQGPAYVPWLAVWNFGSIGMATRIPGRASRRIVHLFSLLERRIFLELDFDPQVVDIREQFPLLGRPNTHKLANALGLRHPKHTGNRADRGDRYVMTTDFVVTRGTGLTTETHAYAVTSAATLRKGRGIARRTIERAYWTERGIPFSVLTNEDLDPVRAHNLGWLAPFVPQCRPPLPPTLTAETESAALERLRVSDRPLWQSCRSTDEALGLPRGTILTLTRARLAFREWEADLTAHALPKGPIVDLRLGSGFPESEEGR